MRRSLLLFAAFATPVLGASAQDAGPVRKKLDAAREAYNRELLKYQTGAVDWFGKQEDAARAKGDKKLLDAVTAQRAVYAAGGDLPAAAPRALRTHLDAPRKALEAAYADGIKAYVKARKDDDAAAAEAELTKLRYTATSLGRAVGDAPVRVTNKHSGRILAVSDGATADGSAVIQFDDTGGADQRWTLVPVDEDYFVVRNNQSRTYLTKMLKDDRAVVIGKLYEGEAVKNQHWRPVPVPGEAGWFVVQNRVSGKYLSVDNGSREPAARVIQYRFNGPAGSADQWWRFVK
ncbi:RICIN domain-containing protein [bacterium]|nr:RICIN domain-containing protein [bacterium]